MLSWRSFIRWSRVFLVVCVVKSEGSMNILVEKRASRLLGLCLGFVVISSVVVASDQEKSVNDKVAGLSLSVTPPSAGGSGLWCDAAGGSPVAAEKRTKKARSGSISSGGSSRGEKRGADSFVEIAMARSVSPARGPEAINMDFYSHMCARALISHLAIQNATPSALARAAVDFSEVDDCWKVLIEGAFGGDIAIPGIAELEMSVAENVFKPSERIQLMVQGNAIFSAYLVALAANTDANYPLAHVTSHLRDTDIAWFHAVPNIPHCLNDLLQLVAINLLSRYQDRLNAKLGLSLNDFVRIFFTNLAAIGSAADPMTFTPIAQEAITALNAYQRNAYQLMTVYRYGRVVEIAKTFNSFYSLASSLVGETSDAALAAATSCYNSPLENGFL
ncbi:MAG: hypothetical protein QG632_803 [Candidatus Dependentiae bacterium]|nr:hypothetical protein [Candidatus Dependentiae bacterium]